MAYRWTMEDIDRIRSRKPTTLPVQPSPSHTLPVDATAQEVNARLKAAMQGKSPRKYRNVKVVDADGLTHDSRKEFRRWQDLQTRLHAGEISQLHRQPVFDLIVTSPAYPDGLLVCKYIADSSYVENATGAQVVEDCKSEPTRKNRAYRIKVKLMRACHNIEVKEV
jgi:hypothetical protein